MHRRFSVELVEKLLTTWRCAGCQVPVNATVQPTGKPCGGYGYDKRCGIWLSTKILDDQAPIHSMVRRVIETVVGVGWGRGRMSSACEPHIRSAVGLALQQELGDQYQGHTITFEESRDSALFKVNIRGTEHPILYRFPWPDWTPNP